ncbi:MAG: riboflavin synthase [Polyangia bacterium]
MFTGLVEEVGRIAAVTRQGQGVRLGVEARILDEIMPLGASLAIDGVCLTVVTARPGHVELEVGPETMQRSTLGTHAAGRHVNLERAMRLGDRMGGHLVQGHVDGVGRIVETSQRGESWDVRIAMPELLLRYVIEKGSICIDGISLTINALESDGFRVSLIPHSQSATTLAKRVVGDRVNLEVDLIGKYVERLLGPRAQEGGLTLAMLKENGYV